ncbi:MAG: carboxypeptidase-like regulatory domain-containing protein [Planctomycetota bacterium]
MKKVVLGALVLVATVACWFWWHRVAATPAVPQQGNQADSAASSQRAPATDAPDGADAADTAAQPEARREAVHTTAPADHTWVVRGRVMKRRGERYPGARVRLACFTGQGTDGEALHEGLLTADQDGAFAWTLPRPVGTVTIRSEGAMPQHTESVESLLVPAGDAAPQDVEVWMTPLDCTVTGIVLDEQRRPVPDAWVGSVRNKRPVAADGSFSLQVANAYGSTRVEAGAPGHANARQTIVLDDDTDPVVEFLLQPGFPIRGRVVDESGAGVEGAQVATFFTMYDPVTSGADGHFELTHADAARGSHSLFARKDGYVEAKEQVDGKQPRGEYVLRLTRGCRVHGRVFGPDGSPVSCAGLYIGFSPNAYDRLDAVTLDDGSFEFAAVAPGSRTLVTARKGLAPDTRVIEVPVEGDDLRVDVQLLPGHFVSGVVVDTAGDGIAGIMVSARQVRPEGAQHRRQRGEYLDVRATTGPDGTFRLDGLPAGVVILETYGSNVIRKEVPDIAVDRGDVRIVVERAAKLAGRVVDDATGEPVRQFRVHLFRPELAEGEASIGGYSATWVREGHEFRTTDGVFRTENEQFAVGAVAGVVVSAPGYAQTRHERCIAAHDPAPDDCLVRLVRGGTIRGTIVADADGEPIAGARVLHFAAEQPPSSFDRENGARIRATSAADGTFVLEDLPPGPAALLVEVEGLPAHREAPLTIAVGSTVEHTVRVPAGAGLSGVVLDLDRRPLAGADVTVTCGDSSAEATTDDHGRFRTESILSPGECDVVVRSARGKVAFAIRGRASLLAGQTADIELAPTGRGLLRITVDGAPAEGAVKLSATLVSKELGFPRYAAVSTGNTCELRGLPAGEYRVFASADRSFGQATCTLGDAAAVDVTVTVRTFGR